MKTKKLLALICFLLIIASTTQAWAVSTDDESFIGKISLAMNMDTDTLWGSSSSAAFGAVMVMIDISSEKIPGIEFSGITNVYLAQISIEGEGDILAYFYFSDNTYICAIFNPETGRITPAKIEYDTTPKRAMALMAQTDIIEDFCIIDIDDMDAIVKDLLN